MKPIVLIHGYSAESKQSDKSSITSIYGSLPRDLRRRYGREAVVEINLSRYISLEDGITIDDVSRGLQRALRDKYEHLLDKGFHAIVHSTGALVIRNWLRGHSAKPSPLQNLVYLAGANFGSGWAHIGKGQFAKWGRLLFRGEERGVRILHALELGSDWTIDLHRHFLTPANRLSSKYGVFEHVVIGTQADSSWFAAPIRYMKEDGSDGVVRVSASNLNFNYVRFGATAEARQATWRKASGEQERHLERKGRRTAWYEIVEASRPGIRQRPELPFAIPYECAHSGEDLGIVTGKSPREQVLRLLDLALNSTAGNWPGRVEAFRNETEETYRLALERQRPGILTKLFTDPRAQYDRHAQVVVRLRDQDGRPVPHYDIYFDSLNGRRDGSLPLNALVEHKHINTQTPNIITFYLRTDVLGEGPAGDVAWTSRVPQLDGCYLEVTAVEPETSDIIYLPLRYDFSKQDLERYIVGNQTTVIDVELLRVPSPNVYRIVTY